jgi:hypothetical protein
MTNTKFVGCLALVVMAVANESAQLYMQTNRKYELACEFSIKRFYMLIITNMAMLRICYVISDKIYVFGICTCRNFSEKRVNGADSFYRS